MLLSTAGAESLTLTAVVEHGVKSAGMLTSVAQWAAPAAPGRLTVTYVGVFDAWLPADQHIPVRIHARPCSFCRLSLCCVQGNANCLSNVLLLLHTWHVTPCSFRCCMPHLQSASKSICLIAQEQLQSLCAAGAGPWLAERCLDCC